ncbi:MAG: DUF975 family protein [Lachnospiraceae bacterium]|nr:DUF975 family protein [Lachnospiraceae bacterium]
MRNSREYRRMAGESLAGNYGVVIGASIICTIVMNMLTAPLSIISGIGNLTGMVVAGSIITVPASLVISLVSVLFNTGVDKMVFDVTKGERAEFGNLFYCFTHDPLTVVCSCLWILLYLLPALAAMLAGAGIFAALVIFTKSDTALLAGTAILLITTLFYIVWVAVIGLSVSMTCFLYFDNPGMKAGDLVRSSMQMMKGRKLRLFKLYLSYAGFLILGILSCGLAFLWISPNITAAAAYFYQDIYASSPETSGISQGTAGDPVGSENTYYQQDYWN